MARDAKELGVLVFQFLELHVLDGVDELIIYCFVRRPCVVVNFISFIMLLFHLILVGRGGFHWDCKINFGFRRFHPRHVG